MGLYRTHYTHMENLAYMRKSKESENEKHPRNIVRRKRRYGVAKLITEK